jgi:uncharacterized damage-inducible protein DinB
MRARPARSWSSGYSNAGKFPVFGEETLESWFIWHVIDHEFHHRGQIFRMMRFIGVDPPIA